MRDIEQIIVNAKKQAIANYNPNQKPEDFAQNGNLFNEIAEKIKRETADGTYIHPMKRLEALRSERERVNKGKILLHRFKYDGSDLKIIEKRKANSEPYILVVDSNCLGYSRKDSLLRAIREITEKEIIESGYRKRLGMYCPVEGVDFALYPSLKPGNKGALDLYVNPVTIMLLCLKKLKGMDAFRKTIDHDLEKRCQELLDKFGLLVERHRPLNSSEYFKKRDRDYQFDQDWIAKNRTAQGLQPSPHDLHTTSTERENQDHSTLT